MRKPNLLILEDDVVQQKLYKVICARFSFNCTIVSRSKDLMDLLQQDSSSFDVLLSDWALQNESGLDCVENIRGGLRNGSRGGLPIIMITAHAMQGDRETCIRAGADDYLSKPFTLEEFHAMIMKWVDQTQESFAHDAASPIAGASIAAAPDMVEQQAAS